MPQRPRDCHRPPNWCNKNGAAAAPSDDTLTVGRLYARVGAGLPSTLRASAVPGQERYCFRTIRGGLTIGRFTLESLPTAAAFDCLHRVPWHLGPTIGNAISKFAWPLFPPLLRGLELFEVFKPLLRCVPRPASESNSPGKG